MSMLKAPNVTAGEWTTDGAYLWFGREADDVCKRSMLMRTEVRSDIPLEQAYANAKMLAASKKLADALASLLELHPQPSESSLESFERIGDAFLRDTGMLRPGKDQAPGTGHSMKDRNNGFAAWWTAKIETARTALLSAGYTESK